MAYLTKDKSGLIQLWNNKPELSKDKSMWLAWVDKANSKNEIGIDVTSNNYFRNLFTRHKIPCCLSIIKSLVIEVTKENNPYKE